MTTYLIRRVLLIIPTLIGITCIVFMLVALSPGGVGAALQFAGGAGGDASARAQQEAYLEDRYGLADPVLVQYGRWLGRVSPVKFGARDQVDPRGELIRPPRPPKPPAMGGEWCGAAPAAIPLEGAGPRAELPAHAEERDTVYRSAAREYAEARASSVVANQALQEAIEGYARAAGVPGVVNAEGKLRESVLRRHSPDRARPEWAAVESAGNDAMRAYDAARAAHQALLRIHESKPYREAGFWIVPGLVSLATPDLGVAFSRGRPVAELIAQALPVTLMLNLIAFPIIYMIAVPTGVMSAVKQGKWFDSVSGLVVVALWSIPPVVAGVLLVGFLSGANYLGWFPSGGLNSKEAADFTFLPSLGPDGAMQRGWLFDRVWHITLPIICLVYGGFAVLTKQMRAAMLDTYGSDHVRTARAKGLPAREVVIRHVLRNSLLPVITLFASIFPAMLAGSVVVERIFSIPGMGTLLIEAIHLRDRELLLANALMIGAVNLLGLLLADVLYALADPRIAYD